MSNDRDPDAYGLLDEGEVWYATPFREEAEQVLTRTGDTDSAIVYLYRQPILTDAEREAIAWFSIYSDTPCEVRHAVVLAKLLQRTN
jgi:hypothetical protein